LCQFVTVMICLREIARILQVTPPCPSRMASWHCPTFATVSCVTLRVWILANSVGSVFVRLPGAELPYQGGARLRDDGVWH
jgi:hypothetical protein